MTKDLITHYDARLQRVNGHWTFFLTLTIVLIGWLLTYQSALKSVAHNIIFCLAVFIPYLLNAKAIINTQCEMINIQNDLINYNPNLEEDKALYNTKFVKGIMSHKLSWYPNGTLWVFGFIALLLIVLLFLN